jgi:hypothetical protein
MNPDLEAEHPDTVLVDRLTAYLNSEHEPSGADTLEYLSLLIDSSGRPLLAETWEFTTDLTEDRYGLLTATITAGPFTIRVTQPTDRSGDLTVAITSADPPADRNDYGPSITVDDRPVLDPMTFTHTSSVPPDLQWTQQTQCPTAHSCRPITQEETPMTPHTQDPAGQPSGPLDPASHPRTVVVPVTVLVNEADYALAYGDVDDLEQYTAETVRAAATRQMDLQGWGQVQYPEPGAGS